MSAPSFRGNNNNNKKQDPPVNKLSKINVDIANVVAKNKNQFVVESEGPSTGKSFLNNRPVDDYGRGAPTDRLTFGYAPSVAAEAVAFHSRFNAKKWKIERRLRYKSRCLRTRAVFLQEQASLANGTLKQTGVVNFEPDTSAIKLRLYWIEKAEEERKLLSGGGVTTAMDKEDNNNSKTVVAGTNKNDQQGTKQSASNQQQQQGKSKAGGDGSFSKLLSDMFGGEFTNTNNNNEGKKESGQRRQREE